MTVESKDLNDLQEHMARGQEAKKILSGHISWSWCHWCICLSVVNCLSYKTYQAEVLVPRGGIQSVAVTQRRPRHYTLLFIHSVFEFEHTLSVFTWLSEHIALWVKPLRNLEFKDLAKWVPPPPFLVEMIFSDTKYLKTIINQFHFLSNMWYEMRWTIWYHIL